jgi:hypothetical protein
MSTWMVRPVNYNARFFHIGPEISSRRDAQLPQLGALGSNSSNHASRSLLASICPLQSAIVGAYPGMHH